jgi:hypothetical protein
MFRPEKVGAGINLLRYRLEFLARRAIADDPQARLQFLRQRGAGEKQGINPFAQL